MHGRNSHLYIQTIIKRHSTKSVQWSMVWKTWHDMENTLGWKLVEKPVATDFNDLSGTCIVEID